MALLLSNYNYIQSFTPTDNDFQEKLKKTRPHIFINKKNLTPCILVFTYSNDVEVSKLSFDMARNGIRLFRIDSDRPFDSPIDFVNQHGIIASNNEKLQPKLVIIRHFFPRNRDDINQEYSYQQLRNLIGIFRGKVKYLNDGISDISLLHQLHMAQKVGLETPKGIITNSPKKAFYTIKPVTNLIITKSLGTHWIPNANNTYLGIFPRKISLEDICTQPPEPVPILFQEYIAHINEVRVYIVGDKIHSFRVKGKKQSRRFMDKQKRYRNPDM